MNTQLWEGGERAEVSLAGPTITSGCPWSHGWKFILPCQVRWSGIFDHSNPSVPSTTKSVPYLGSPGHSCQFLTHSVRVTAILPRCRPLQEYSQKWVRSLPLWNENHSSFSLRGSTSPGWAAHLIQTLRHKGLFTFIAPTTAGFFFYL